MFGFFMKTEKLYSCANGLLADITECKDNVFSQKMMGDGVLIIPSDNIIYAPCTGKIELLFPTKHAIGIKTKDNIELMIHIGLDTVDLQGEGFVSYVKEGDKVKAGAPLVRFDAEFMKKKNKDMSIMMILLNTGQRSYIKRHLNEHITTKDFVIQLE